MAKEGLDLYTFSEVGLFDRSRRVKTLNLFPIVMEYLLVKLEIFLLLMQQHINKKANLNTENITNHINIGKCMLTRRSSTTNLTPASEDIFKCR